MGKTALLARLRRAAEQHGMLTVHTELAGDVESDLSSARLSLLGAARALPGANIAQLTDRLRGLRLGPAGVTLAGSDSEDVSLRDVVVELSVLARATDRPILITVDEARENPEIAGEILAGAHRAAQDDHPLAVWAAGLPGTHRAVARVHSYIERVPVHRLTSLDRDGVGAAIERPFTEHGLAVDAEVCDAVTARSTGYPYFVQVWGDALWRHTRSPDRVSMSDLHRAAPAVDRELHGFLDRRWRRFTPAQQNYLKALAAEGGEARTSELAERLGRPVTSLSRLRDTLIEDGAIYAPERGRVAVVLPPLAQHAVRR